ncbi:hypothetical protein H0H87_010378 [Tephrocybe sp. NHM501043]|nr:hypothetical protein H0H87_010378 [Tephrocybe sp. NHM501043]
MRSKASRFIIVDGSTIQDSNDEPDLPRSKKRQRTEDNDGPSASESNPFKKKSPIGSVQPEGKPRTSLRADYDGTEILIHDPQYYFGDDPEANCYIRVEKIIFKVHSTLLFMSKLMETRITGRAEPTTGRDPLELFGVSVIEFRALMWARYATEDDAQDQPRDLDDLERLLSLSTITKTLEFDRLHQWTLDSMQRAFSSDVSLVDSCSSVTLTRVIEVATQFKATELLNAAVSKWCNRVQRKDSPAVPAIIAADEHKLKSLGGIAYYTHLLEAIEQAPPPTDASPLRILADPKLNSKQLIRLLSGHLALVGFSDRYRRRAPKLECGEGCTAEAHRACTRIWNERWRAAAGSPKVLALCSADILGLVVEINDRMAVDAELEKGLTKECRMAGLKSLKRNVADTQTRLPQYF